MDHRLLIKPWKMDLVERHFKEDSEFCPRSQTDVLGCKGGILCPIATTSSTEVRICRPKLISKLKNPKCEGKDKMTSPPFTNIVQTSSQDHEPHLSSTVSLSEVSEEVGPLLTHSSVKNLTVCPTTLVYKLNNPPVEAEDDVTRSTSEPALLVCRPKIIQDWRKFPIKQIVQDETDRGRSCVSVVLKSSSSTVAAERSMKLSERIRDVEELSSKYSVKYEGKSENSKRSEARLDFCFLSARDARGFFGKVNDLLRGGGGLRQMSSVIMYAEESLG